MAYKIYPYIGGSRSAKALALALGGKVLKKQGSKYRYKEGDIVINWGAGDSPWTSVDGKQVANQPEAIRNASNKLTAFNAFKEHNVSIPEFTTDKVVAQGWVRDGTVVMCRTKLQGHSAEGLVVAEKVEDVVNAPLYTKYVPKKHEYRVHVLRGPNNPEGSIIVIQRKAKRHDAEKVDYKVRNLANGFVYVLDDVAHVPASVLEESRKAVQALGLAFGAVDVIYNERANSSYVLEINTAPGLEERTAEAYANAFLAL